jgi:hypothetical protein
MVAVGSYLIPFKKAELALESCQEPPLKPPTPSE